MECFDDAAAVAMAELLQTGEILIAEVEARCTHDVEACSGARERCLDGTAGASAGR